MGQAQVTNLESFVASSRIRNAVRKEITAFVDDILAEAIGTSLGRMMQDAEQRCAALETKLNGLQSAISEFRFCGQWQEGKTYRAGNFVSTGGQVWHCNADTSSKPGIDSTFSLAVKSGRDGRDGRDFTPPEPPTPRVATRHR